MVIGDLARLWHHLAVDRPQRTALIHDGIRLSWAQFDAAAAGGAEILGRDGIRPGHVIAVCLPNIAEYLVVVAAVLRCGAIPCGINHRYTTGELASLLGHVEPAAVCYAPHRSADVRDLADQLPAVKRWYPVGPGTGHRGLSLHRMMATPADATRLDSDPHDVLLKCTGGTTGAPVAVRWSVGDVLTQLNTHNPWHRHDLTTSKITAPRRHPVTLLLASPLMHGSGLTRAFGALCAGGTVITLAPGGFNAARLLDAAHRHQVRSIAIVGDAHALPLTETLDAHPRRWPLPALQTITSSGATWSHDIKKRLLAHLPHLRLLESFGATEATGLGFSVATIDRIPPTGEFELGRHATVLTGQHRTQPGHTGAIGVSWPHPVGVHPDGDLPADRFREHAGQRYLMSGDQVHLHDTHRFTVLGRGVECINTGGEKVWAPEVADVLRHHPGVRDALVVAVPDPRLGHAVAALVELHPGTTPPQVQAHARQRLAGYKVPTTVVAVAALPRTAAGKPDLATARVLAEQHTGAAS